MKTLLLSLPPEQDALHGGRAWAMASALMEACACRITTDGEWRPEGLDGALVTNSVGDLHTLRRCRDIGIPALYYPSLGPVQGGFLYDQSLYDLARRLHTRLKFQFAHGVLVESWAQARAARAHYGICPAWLVHPGGAYLTTRYESRTAGRLYIVGDPAEEAQALIAWCEKVSLYYCPVLHEWECLSHLAPADCVLYRTPPWHPAGVLTLAALKIATVVPENGVLDRLPLSCVTQDTGPIDALEKARQLPPALETPSWTGWTAAILRVIEQLTPGVVIRP